MSVEHDLRRALTNGGLGELLVERVAAPPWIYVAFGGSSPTDQGLVQGTWTIWLALPPGEDISPVAAQIWRAVRQAPTLIPLSVVADDGPPGSGADAVRLCRIIGDTSDRWWQQPDM